jgi:CheY-like chemotaxis protein
MELIGVGWYYRQHIGILKVIAEPSFGSQAYACSAKFVGTADKPGRRLYADWSRPQMLANPDFICVIDDDVSVLKSIVRLLHADQLEARSFEAAEDFLAHARKHKVHLAVLDLWMQKMNGLEVQARLREISPETKVIFISANALPEMRAAALKAGAIAFLEKPFDAEFFLFIARQALPPVLL